MPIVKLNARNITTLQAVGDARTDYRDELLPGFFLRVTPQGTRTFGIVYTTRDGRLRRCTLGPVGPLGLSQARAQAKRPWVFPSPTTDRPIENPQKAAERLRERSKVPDLRLHDLRATAASLMTGMGISRLAVKKILNHAERDVTAVYDRHSYDPEKRSALEAWGRRLEVIVSGATRPAVVVRLGRASASRGA